MRLSDYEDQFRNHLALELGMAKQSIVGHMSSFRVLYRALPDLEDFTYENVLQYIYDQRQTKSASAVRYYVNVLQKLCTFLYQRNIIKENFRDRLKAPRPKPSIDIETFTAAELKTIQEAPVHYPDDAIRESFDLVHGLLARTGMRVGELCNLKVRHFDFSTNTIKILETKTDQPRIVPIPHDLLDRVGNSLKGKESDEWAFTNSLGNKFSNQTVWRDLQRRVKEAGIKKRAYVHLYRHSFATIMLASGCPLPLVSEILGHRNISTTQRYTHLLVSQLSDAMTKYHPLIRQSLTKEDKIRVLSEAIRQSDVFSDSSFRTNVDHGPNHFTVKIEW